MPGPFETRQTRSTYYLTDVLRSWPPEKQAEHLRDLNMPTLWSISMHEVFPGHFLHFQHLRAVQRGEVAGLADLRHQRGQHLVAQALVRGHEQAAEVNHGPRREDAVPPRQRHRGRSSAPLAQPRRSA